MESELVVGASLFVVSIGSILTMSKFKNRTDDQNFVENGVLSDDLIREFIEKGVVVIPGVLSAEEINEARNGFHQYLSDNGVWLLYRTQSPSRANVVFIVWSYRFEEYRQSPFKIFIHRWGRRYIGYILSRLEVESQWTSKSCLVDCNSSRTYIQPMHPEFRPSIW